MKSLAFHFLSIPCVDIAFDALRRRGHKTRKSSLIRLNYCMPTLKAKDVLALLVRLLKGGY